MQVSIICKYTVLRTQRIPQRHIFSSTLPNDPTVSSFPLQGLDLDVDIKHAQVGKRAGSKTCIETDNATIQEQNRAAEQ